MIIMILKPNYPSAEPQTANIFSSNFRFSNKNDYIKYNILLLIKMNIKLLLALLMITSLAQTQSINPIDNNHQANPNCTVIGCETCADSPDKCDKCDSGYALDTKSFSCFSCRTIYKTCATCEVVTGTFVCTTCDTGYFPTTTDCALCNKTLDKCLNCNNDGTACITCEVNYVLSQKLCISCSVQYPDCISCEDNKCVKCGNGKVLSDDGLICNQSSAGTIIIVSAVVGGVVLLGAGLAIFKCMKKKKRSPLADEDYEKI